MRGGTPVGGRARLRDGRLDSPPMRVLRPLRPAAGAALGAAVLAAAMPGSGCSPGTTPTYPQPDIQAVVGEAFPMRAGYLALVLAPNAFLYLSVQSVGVDTRCPAGASCDEPGFIELRLELESATSQSAVALQVSEEGQAVATYQGFEIRVLDARPEGRAERILPTEYLFVMSVVER